ncbi:cell wall-associated NlpC family hydrolase [Thermocatellispora tengchongensis]|uniref:Cell wall-associated NlpC family hydrolase n=1 Tax=Thermocatellispora tengchongensis TaxID=1073253 RepID=A0A840P4G8_9ACTN|nr:CHAP domain-containing protein [Thermocatellispora tengchongensis]MBB5132127.1 cell wall-associated NlpC family hydrolase [Thermocatellispora tengchongensis]
MAINVKLPRSVTKTLRLSLGAAVTAGAIVSAAPAFAAAPEAAPKAAPAAVADQPQTLPQAKVSAQTVLRIAESQLGISENAAGGGTPYHTWYMSSQRAKETAARDGGTINAYANAPWCAMFVSWVGEKAGITPSIGWDAYTVSWAKWFEANGHYGHVAQPGAVVFFNWEGDRTISGIDHVGLVKKDNGDGTITTIEGNTGNGKVEERVRPVSHVAGYGYPAYKA